MLTVETAAKILKAKGIIATNDDFETKRRKGTFKQWAKKKEDGYSLGKKALDALCDHLCVTDDNEIQNLGRFLTNKKKSIDLEQNFE